MAVTGCRRREKVIVIARVIERMKMLNENREIMASYIAKE